MILKFKRLFLTLGVFLLSIICVGCSQEKGNEPKFFIYIDFFYEEEDDILFENKVIIGIGNDLFDENNVKVIAIDDAAYQGITNICLSVFIDNEVEPKKQIEISSADFFSNKYIVDINNRKRKQTDYANTFTFDLSDFEINSFIKFVVSYDWKYQEDNRNHSYILFLYGNFLNDKFIIYKKNSIYNKIIDNT